MASDNFSVRGKIRQLVFLCLVASTQLAMEANGSAQEIALEPIGVTLERRGDQWRLIRAGQPVYVRGAGGEGSLDLLKSCGANSSRTWGVDKNTKARLDEAHRNGISVAVGIWLGHERHGFDYGDESQVTQQFDSAIAAVEKYKSHPAVLVWGIGNEMENFQDGDNPDIWNHVEKLAAKIKQIDPLHPTMTVIAGVGGKKISALHKLCPSIDIVGINSYGGAQSLPQAYRQFGGAKPYLVTEFGPRGTWEVTRNSIGSIDEETSTQKAETYRLTYQTLQADSELCLGSYAFLWGNKQEGTATWFGLLLPDGKKTGGVDALAELWSGKLPDNLCPTIAELRLDGSNDVQPGASVKFSLKASDPEGKRLNVRWELHAEAAAYVTGGDFQSAPDSFNENIIESAVDGATIQLPESTGLYRVYAFVDDGNGGAAVANVPLRVSALQDLPPAEKVELPFVLYDEPNSGNSYVPSGWMGNTQAMSLDQESNDNPKSGAHCIEFKYSKQDNWGGVVWQSPPDDWGEKPGGYDLTGAKRLSFWGRGGVGGEKIKFGFGILGREKKYFDTAKDEMTVTLESTWKQYTFDLSNADLTRIKSGFYLTVAGQSEPIQFFLDRVVFE